MSARGGRSFPSREYAVRCKEKVLSVSYLHVADKLTLNCFLFSNNLWGWKPDTRNKQH